MKQMLFLFCVLMLTAGCAIDTLTSVPVTDGIPVVYRLPKGLEYGFKGIDFNQFRDSHNRGETLRGTEIMIEDDRKALTVRRGMGHYSPHNENRFLGSFTDYFVTATVKDLGTYNEIIFVPVQKMTQDNGIHGVPAFSTKEVVNSLVWSTVRFTAEYSSELNQDSVINKFNRKLKNNSLASKDINNVYEATYVFEIDGLTINCATKISPNQNGSKIKLTLVLPLQSEDGGKLVDATPQIEKLKKYMASVVAD